MPWMTAPSFSGKVYAFFGCERFSMLNKGTYLGSVVAILVAWACTSSGKENGETIDELKGGEENSSEATSTDAVAPAIEMEPGRPQAGVPQDESCRAECADIEGCEAISAYRSTDAGCLEPGFVCGVPTVEPDIVIAAESPDGECLEFPSGTPEGWRQLQRSQCVEGSDTCAPQTSPSAEGDPDVASPSVADAGVETVEIRGIATVMGESGGFHPCTAGPGDTNWLVRIDGQAAEAFSSAQGGLMDCQIPGSPVACHTYLEGVGIIGELGETTLFEDSRSDYYDRQALFTELYVIQTVESAEVCPPAGNP